ncbi:MAG: NUDIX domain-containing protein [Rikenellaceae bacterium]
MVMCHLFYKDKDIIFVDNNSENRENNIIFAPTLTVEDVVFMFRYYKEVYILSDDPQKAFNIFTSHLKRIEAAGGVVASDEDEVLMIKRNGRWDIPKGKREIGEDMPTCAVREVQEECGIGALECGDLICITNHIYQIGKNWVVKPTSWYHMKNKGAKEQLKPQTEEGIEIVEWVKINDLSEKTKESYSTIKHVIRNL